MRKLKPQDSETEEDGKSESIGSHDSETTTADSETFEKV